MTTPPYPQRQGWMDHPVVVVEHVGPLLAGGPFTDRNWLLDTFSLLPIARGGRWLCIGCGSAGQELWAIAQGLFGAVHGVDVSPAALDAGRAEAKRQEIGAMTFELADLDVYRPGDDAHFDGIVATMTLSRIPNVARLVRECSAQLRPGGWFLVNDYIGPARFQAPDRVLQIVEDLITVLPDRLRRHSMSGQLRDGWARRPLEFWEEQAPREAVSSRELRSALGAEPLELTFERGYGGSLLAPLLELIVANFRDDPEDQAILRLLCRFEEILLREGIVASDFGVLAARRR